MYAEFVSFVNEIASKDTETCYEMLDHSLAVSRILTRARADAGIVFDEGNPSISTLSPYLCNKM